MTINSETRVAGPFEGNDSTVAFPFEFKVFDSDELFVVDATDAVETVLELGTDFTVTLNPDQNAAPGGTVTLTAPLATDSTLTLTSALEALQPLDLTNQGGFYPRVINNAFDRVTILIQQLKAVVGRTLKFPLSDGPVGDLPGRSARAGSVLAFDLATGEPVVGPSIAAVGTVAGAVAAINAVAPHVDDIEIVADNLDDLSNFADVYYGPSASNPTTRRDGTPLQPGDLYFNTVEVALRVYDGTAWRDPALGTVSLMVFSGDGEQTDFQLDVAPADKSQVDIHISGVYQQKATYSVEGDVLSFTQAPPDGEDNIEVVVGSHVDLANFDGSLRVNSIAEMRAITNPTSVRLIDWHGDWTTRAKPVPVGGGYFAWDALSTATDNGGTIIELDAFATGRMVRLTDNAPVNPCWFGALGDGLADDGASLQASVTFAENNGGFWFLPAGTFKSSVTIVQTRRLTAFGAGKGKSYILYTGDDEGWLAQPPFAGASNTDWMWRDFAIAPETPGGGTYGLRIQLADAVTPAVCFLADSQITNMFIGDFGLQGLYLDNSVANTDGFFTSQFCGNTIVNGVLGVKIGDSLRFAHNKIYGRNCGLELTGVPGARQMTLDDNNITTTGGLVALIDVEEASLRDNQLEHPGYLSGYTGVFDAGVVLHNCYKPEIVGNTINPDNGAASAPVSPGLPSSTMALSGTTSGAIIDGNDIQKGLSFHINIGNDTVLDTFVGEFNTYYGAAPVIGDGGTGTKRILYGALSYDPPSIPDGTATGTSVSVPGAQLGMQVQVSFAQNLAGLLLTGWVLSPDTVTVQLANFTGAPVNLAPAVLRVKVTS